ncbi:MAG: AbrB/MazE/SpoVT family DNA-binding domain-containing protein [Nanoarchaeota archaeon]
MEIIRDVGEKGQVVIPIDIRILLGLKNKSKVVFEVKGNEVKIKSKKEENWLKQFLRYQKKGKSLTLKELKKIEEESYDLP